MVLARARGAIGQFCTTVRPGGVVAVLAAAAAVACVAFLPRFPALDVTIGRVTIPLAMDSLLRFILFFLLLFGFSLIVLAWWLPAGRHSALWAIGALAGLALPFFLRDGLHAACALLIAAGALAPVLVHGNDDGPALFFLGTATLGVACLAAGLLLARTSGLASGDDSLALARWLALAGLALLLGIAPAPLWLPGLLRHSHPLGAALAAGAFPLVVMAVTVRAIDAGAPFDGWLTSALDYHAVLVAGVATMVVAGACALAQRDVRSLAGFLLVADLGYTVAGAGLAALHDSWRLAPVLVPLGGRAVGVAILIPSLAFVTSGFRCSLRPALVLMLACGAWISLGGPLTVNYAWHAEVLHVLVDESPTLGTAMATGVLLMALGWLALVVRAWRIPLLETTRPCPRLALLVLAGLVCVSLLI